MFPAFVKTTRLDLVLDIVVVKNSKKLLDSRNLFRFTFILSEVNNLIRVIKTVYLRHLQLIFQFKQTFQSFSGNW